MKLVRESSFGINNVNFSQMKKHLYHLAGKGVQHKRPLPTTLAKVSLAITIASKTEDLNPVMTTLL
jgi:hypothetical protein